MTRVRKWLGASIKIELSLGELLAIVALVIVINLLWPGVPTWVFILIGAGVGVAKSAVGDFGRWLRRRSTT